jgi:hypothetical protein
VTLSAYRTPLLDRIDAFKARRPDISITPWYQSESCKWETTEPGRQERRAWINGTAMMEHLEKTYPEETNETAKLALCLSSYQPPLSEDCSLQVV